MKTRFIANTMDFFDKNIRMYVHGLVISKLDSGALNLEDYDTNDYELPKLLLHVILREVSEQIKPRSAKGKREASNLAKF